MRAGESLKILSVLVISVALFSVFAELFLRLFFPQPILPLVYKQHPILKYKLKEDFKGFQSSSEFRVQVALNSEGLRDVEHGPLKENGVVRILALGDSFTLGDGVEMEESYPKVLEEVLNHEKHGKTFEVINAGVYGWDASQEYLYLKHYGLRYNPDLIIWGLYVGNDFYDTARGGLLEMEAGVLRSKPVAIDSNLKLKALLEQIPAYPYLSHNSHLLTLMKRGVSKLISIKKDAEFGRFTLSLYSRAPIPEVRDSIELIKEILKDGYGLAQSNGASFLLVIIPAYEQIYTERYGLSQEGVAQVNKEILEFCKEAGIPCIDLFPEIKRVVKDGKMPYYPKNRHWNEEGHRLAAEVMRNRIELDFYGR